MALSHLDKKEVVDSMLLELRRRIQRMTSLARNTREDAIHEESRPEDDKDTRGLEASYLARGQAQRVAELEDDLTLLRLMELRRFGSEDMIELSALVEIEDEEGERRSLLLAPRAGGLEVRIGETDVRIVTPASPLGEELLGRTCDEDFELFVNGKLREFVITDIA